jgi:hypothetical protein
MGALAAYDADRPGRASIDVGASIEGVFEHHLDCRPIGAAPHQFAFPRPFSHAHPELDLVLSQVADQPAKRAQFVKGAEDEPNDLLHLLVGVELKLSRRAPDVADRQCKLQLAQASLCSSGTGRRRCFKKCSSASDIVPIGHGTPPSSCCEAWGGFRCPTQVSRFSSPLMPSIKRGAESVNRSDSGVL